MYLAYNILYLIALFILFPFEYLKRSRELRNRWLKERLGLYKTTPHYSNTPLPCIWIHAVSVGEVIASTPLIKKIKEKYTDADIIISTVTDTGQKVAQERIGNIAKVIYVPFDIPFAINMAVKKIKPSIFIIVETELWPNIIRIMRRNSIPVLLMNGRISEKSFNRYKIFRFFMQDVLNNINILCMQNELYAERMRELGADPNKIKTIGNFKFDTRPSSAVPEWTGIFRRQKTEDREQTNERGFTIISGSTHRTEEDLILNAYMKLRTDFPRLNLIIAPRHPERFREVEELLKKKGLEYVKRSELHNSWFAESSESHRVSGLQTSYQASGIIILLDVIGELSSVYSVCDIAIMGGSFIEHGGQNPLEPAYWGKAIVCGPHMENFPFIDEFYRTGSALKTDSDSLYESLKGLLISPERILSMGNLAKELYEKNSGAADKAIAVIEKHL
ncbi:3-deoxy-D-manno-octulosonic acid transferase [Dissulfurispira thermophila]|nr:3-deoxy-D-manno-octulosonic acid transferase [Dissulfurispira thermophila]